MWHADDTGSIEKRDLIGETKFLPSELMMKNDRKVSRDLYIKDKPESRGKLFIMADVIKKSDDMLRF